MCRLQFSANPFCVGIDNIDNYSPMHILRMAPLNLGLRCLQVVPLISRPKIQIQNNTRYSNCKNPVEFRSAVGEIHFTVCKPARKKICITWSPRKCCQRAKNSHSDTNFFMQKATTESNVPPMKTPSATPMATTIRIPAHIYVSLRK